MCLKVVTQPIQCILSALIQTERKPLELTDEEFPFKESIWTLVQSLLAWHALP